MVVRNVRESERPGLVHRLPREDRDDEQAGCRRTVGAPLAVEQYGAVPEESVHDGPDDADVRLAIFLRLACRSYYK
jgi:hypothetical protein